MADDLGDDWWVGAKGDKAKKEKKDSKKSEKQHSGKKRKLKEIRSMEIKRKRSEDNCDQEEPEADADEEEEEEEVKENISEDLELETKKKKKHSRRKITDELKEKGDKPPQPSHLTALLSKEFEGKLTKFELDDLLLDESHFALCNDLSHNPTSFLKALVPKWKKMLREMNQVPGSPLLLVLCSSAMRAANFIRLISSFKTKDCKIAKLFAKHFKLEDQMKFLKTTIIHVGVGTANRIQHLLESGELHLDQVRYVILDWSSRDLKQKRLLDIPEVRQDTALLLSKFIIPRVKNSSMMLALL